jgi:poly(3-hydroxybutyrate) depolymerase
VTDGAPGAAPDAGRSDGASAAGDAGAAHADAAGPIDAGGSTADAPSGALAVGTSTLTLPIAGLSRKVTLHVPVASGPVPLVIALHGDGDVVSNFLAASGLLADSDSEGFVLAAPQGITRDVGIYEAGQVVQTVPQVDWDPYNSLQGDGTIVGDHNDDLPLLEAIRQELVASGSVDAKRVVVYGYSQGGYLAMRYGMSDAASVACAAVLAAATPLPGTKLIEQASRKTPVFLQIGTADGAYTPAQQTAQELQTNGNPVQLVAVQGAGHVPIPGDPRVPLDWCLQHPLP